MLVLLAIAALAVLVCVVVVSQGRGGEMVMFAADVPPLELPESGRLTATDVMALHLPVSLVGYHPRIVDEALQRAATALGERDTHIAVLEQRVAELLAGRLQARQESTARPSWAPVVSSPIKEHETSGTLFAPIVPAEAPPATPSDETPTPVGGARRERGSFEPAQEKRGPSGKAESERGSSPATRDRQSAAATTNERQGTPKATEGRRAMGEHEGKPAEDRPFTPPGLTPEQADGRSKPGQHEKPNPKK